MCTPRLRAAESQPIDRKMSTDLSYPLVTSMGLHDPLDGLVTYTQLQATAVEDAGQSKKDWRARNCRYDPYVQREKLGHGRSPWASGAFCPMLLRVAQLAVKGYFTRTDSCSISPMDASLKGLRCLPVTISQPSRELSACFPRTGIVHRIGGDGEAFGFY